MTRAEVLETLELDRAEFPASVFFEAFIEMDPHKVLGVQPGASADEIKTAYRAAATKYHPDAGGDAWVFQQVQEAYATLTKAPKAEPTSPPEKKSPQPANPQAKPATPPPSSQKAVRREKPADWFDTITQKQLPLQNETSYFILANVLDIVLTNMLLRNEAIEANPFAAYFLERWGFAGMIVFKMCLVAFICVLAQFIAVRSLRKAKFVLWAGIVIVGLVVIYSAVLFYGQTR